ncbi:MAG: Holliday junction branch migration protein RuvA [Clostridiaceae bacterium]|nr:Holliday junction branch migration protein RuvA [Clostridiaceae bacterium]
MFEYIKGTYMGMNKDYIIIETNGIGYRIFTSGSTIAKMPKTNESVMLYLEQIVREDFIGLYGFLSKEEIDMFKLLLTVSGVGAKAALSFMSILTVTNIKYSIITSDEKNIMRAPGVGKKIAQRIILELKDKVKVKGDQSELNSVDGLLGIDNSNLEVIAALISLGYSDKEAQMAIKSVEIKETIEDTIKNCLKFLMK